MIKRLANKIIDFLVPALLDELLKLSFDVQRISDSVFQVTVFYDGIVVFDKIINLKKPNS